MANVDIDVGGGKTVNVDIDGLETMAPEQQQFALRQVQNQVAPPPPPPPAAPADTTITGAIGYGLHGAAEGLGATAQLAGKETGWQGLADAGKSLQGTFGAPANYQPTNIGADLAAGNYGTALSKLPRAAAEAVPDMAATLGAGALGSFAGPAGTMAGVGAYTAARNAGDNVAARQAANGEDPNALPSTNDLVGAGLTTGAQIAGNVVGLGKVPGIAGKLEALPLAARVPASAALEGAGAAATNLATQAGDTAGTAQGLTVDPYEAAGAGLQGAAARLGTEAPGAARTGVKAAADGAMTALAPAPASLADAASLSRVADDFQTAQANAAATKGADTSPQAIINTMKSETRVRLVEAIGGLKDAGLMDADQARSAKEVVQNQALRHNNTITESGGDGPSSLFDDIAAIPGLPQEAINALQNGARDLDTMASGSFQNAGNGPFRQLGNLVGRAGTLGSAALSGNPLEMFGAAMGHGIAGKVGGGIGGLVDQAMGTNTPASLLQAVKANAMLKKAGLDNGGSSLQALDDLNGGLSDIRAQQQADALKSAQMDQIKTQAEDQNTLDTTPANLKASATANASAQAATASQADAQVNAYMSGKTLGPDDSVPVGRQTAAEISTNDQRLRNQATQIKMMAAQQKVLAQAQAGQVGNIAQQKLDAAARANAVKLIAPTQMPTPRADIPDAAFAAAMQQAQAQANGVKRQAAAGAPLMDRLSVGLPPDPVPVNTPLDADGVPLQGGPGPSGPPMPARAPTPPQAPPAPPTAPPAPDSSLPPPKAPWMNFVSNGQGHSADQIHQAVDASMADGRITPQDAAALHAHTGQVDADYLAKNIQPYLADVPPAFGSSAAASPATKGPIRDPVRYDRAIANYQKHAADKMAMAGSDDDLKAAILDIRDTPKEADKRAAAASYIASKSGAEKTRAKMLLSGPLLDAPNS